MLASVILSNSALEIVYSGNVSMKAARPERSSKDYQTTARVKVSVNMRCIHWW
jgi:hypothetical protein